MKIFLCTVLLVSCCLIANLLAAQQAIITDSTGRVTGFIDSDSIAYNSLSVNMLDSQDPGINFLFLEPPPLLELPQVYSINEFVIKNSSGKVIGFVDSTNRLRDIMSNLLLDFSISGLIKDVNGDSLAIYNNVSHEIKDLSNQLILKYDPITGYLRDGLEIIIGKIENNGVIKDAGNMVIGYCDANMPAYVGYYFFKNF